MKIVILGSCQHSPYEILASPKPTSANYHNETGYQLACKIFYPAIENADEVWVYAPEGKIGEHTQRDLDYAKSKGKKILFVSSLPEIDLELILGTIEFYIGEFGSLGYDVEEYLELQDQIKALIQLRERSISRTNEPPGEHEEGR